MWVSNVAENLDKVCMLDTQSIGLIHTVVWEKFNGGNFHVKKFRVKIFSSS